MHYQLNTSSKMNTESMLLMSVLRLVKLNPRSLARLNVKDMKEFLTVQYIIMLFIIFCILDEVPMETDSSPRQPTSEDGLPFKIPRSDEADEATPLLEEAEPTVVVMEWHSCVICLEEMVDSELLTHSVCGAMICDTCLQASRTHSGTENGLMPCPVSTV